MAWGIDLIFRLIRMFRLIRLKFIHPHRMSKIFKDRLKKFNGLSAYCTVLDNFCLAFGACGMSGIVWHRTFLLLPKRKVPKENAVLPAAPRPPGIALFLTGLGSIFRIIELRSSCQKRRSPPTSGTIPFGRACLADGEKIC